MDYSRSSDLIWHIVYNTFERKTYGEIGFRIGYPHGYPHLSFWPNLIIRDQLFPLTELMIAPDPS